MRLTARLTSVAILQAQAEEPRAAGGGKLTIGLVC
jgi:hypothetical protein